jgi:uncharacterized RDD family membrane protein YckC
MADVSHHEDSRPGAQVAAPHGGRLVAFGIDLVVVLLVGLVVGGGWFRILGVFVAYHTALVWLTGQTIGKAIANLEVRRIDGRAFERTAMGLAWTLGRSSIGYLLVDMLGLGVLVALPRRNTERRCLHDMVFGSRVVLRGETEWALPKMRKRLSDFATRREDASRAVGEAQEAPRRLNTLWQWMVTGALGLEKILDGLQQLLTQVSSWFGGAGQAHAGAASLSTKTAAAVAAGSGAVTVATVTVIAVAASGPAAVDPSEVTPVGTWGVVDTNRVIVVTATGAEASYVGRNANDYQQPLGCAFKADEIRWQFHGDFPGDIDFDGIVYPGSSAAGSDACVMQTPAIFRLYFNGSEDPADQTLQVCPGVELVVDDCEHYTRR